MHDYSNNKISYEWNSLFTLDVDAVSLEVEAYGAVNGNDRESLFFWAADSAEENENVTQNEIYNQLISVRIILWTS